jgi:flagellar basal-body rod modification protein FlgD
MTTVNNATLAAVNGTGATPATRNDEASADRFLKLLVAQMSNQDPLNPMDNAQVTSQMAQINTVSGIEKLNGTVEALGGQFAQLQLLQGASLVGRDVIVAGNGLTANDKGLPQGGFVLGAPADKVRVEILDDAGRVVDVEDLGARGAGRHGFDWTPAAGIDAGAGTLFRVVATSGSVAVSSMPLMRDRVDAVTAEGGSLGLELRRAGTVGWGDIRAFN